MNLFRDHAATSLPNQDQTHIQGVVSSAFPGHKILTKKKIMRWMDCSPTDVSVSSSPYRFWLTRLAGVSEQILTVCQVQGAGVRCDNIL